jgi:hypothetical protein
MKKTPTLFKRNPEAMREILSEPNPVCDWVFNGEGVATRKYDGTCCLIDNGNFYKRRELKRGKPVPRNFVQADFDTTTGKTVGWVPVDPEAAEDKWYMEAFSETLPDGTYELLGPKVQGNPEGFERHTLLKHSDAEQYPDVERTFDGLRKWMEDKDIEGLVFHHPDGRMAKIKKRDYGLRRT